MRLIEFKREGNRSDKEVAKLAHLRRNLELPENVDLKILSSHVHWYIETKNQGVLVTKICPYLHFLHTRDRGPSLLDFCSELARELLRPGDPALSPLFERYLQCLSKSQGEPASGSGGMMLYTDGSGSLKYVVVDDLRQLDRSLRYVAEKRAEHQQQVDRQIRLEYEREHRLERSHDRGLSR